MTKLDVSCLAVRPTPEMKVRLAAFREERWIGYDSAVRIREQIESLLDHPKTHRMPNLVLIGESNNGKSMILNSVRDRANPAYDINVTKVQLPVIMVQAPPLLMRGAYTLGSWKAWGCTLRQGNLRIRSSGGSRSCFSI